MKNIRHKIRAKTLQIFTILSIGILCLMFISPVVRSDNYWPLHSGMTNDLTFSGRGWWVADWNTYNPSYVSVDSNGWLHLKQHANVDSCVFTYDVCGYGTYTYVMANGIKYIDKNAVIGMFAYRANLTTNLAYQEPDIEQAKWGNENAHNFDFIIQPNSAHLQNYFTMPYSSDDTTFVIDWERGYTQFFILNTVTGNVLKTWNVTCTRDATGVFGVLNIWHYLSATTLDTNIVFKSFTYEANHIYHPPNELTPPVIISNPITTAIQGSTYNYQVESTNNPTYSLTVKPTGMTIDENGLITWSEPTYGEIPVTVKATNEDGTDYQTFNIIVEELQKPVFSSEPITTGVKGERYQYQVIANPSVTSYTIAGNIDATISSTGMISFVPRSTGTFTMQVSATNEDGISYQNYSLSISNPTVIDTVVHPAIVDSIPVIYAPDYGTYDDMSNQAGNIGTFAFIIFAVTIIPAIVYSAIRRK